MGFFSENFIFLIKAPTASDFLNNLDEETEAFQRLMLNVTSQSGIEVMWDKIRPKRTPCTGLIESASRTPKKSLGKSTPSFLQVKQKTLHSSTACATSSPAARAQGQLWCGTAAQPWLSLLGISPVGMHRVDSPAGSA